MNEKVFVCPECGRDFGRAQGLGAHRRQAHGVIGAQRSRSEQTAPVLLSENIQALADLREEGMQRMVDERMRQQTFDRMVEEPEATSGLFDDQLQEFLPHLAAETLRRFVIANDELVEPFLVLYLDAHGH